MRLFARVGGVLIGSALLAGCFSPLTTLPAPPDAWGAAGGAAACGSGLQLGSYCDPASRSAVVLPDPNPDSAVADPLPGAQPAEAPAWFPIAIPAALPTAAPTVLPTAAPVALPTPAPVQLPVDEPTLVPIVIPADLPAGVPTAAPIATPTPALTPVPDDADDGARRPPGHGDGKGHAGKGDRPPKDKNKGKDKGRQGD